MRTVVTHHIGMVAIRVAGNDDKKLGGLGHDWHEALRIICLTEDWRQHALRCQFKQGPPAGINVAPLANELFEFGSRQARKRSGRAPMTAASSPPWVLPKHAVTNDFDAAESFRQRALDSRKQFVTTKEIIPQERHAFSRERVEPRGQRLCLHRQWRPRPDDVVTGFTR